MNITVVEEAGEWDRRKDPLDNLHQILMTDILTEVFAVVVLPSRSADEALAVSLELQSFSKIIQLAFDLRHLFVTVYHSRVSLETRTRDTDGDAALHASVGRIVVRPAVDRLEEVRQRATPDRVRVWFEPGTM